MPPTPYCSLTTTVHVASDSCVVVLMPEPMLLDVQQQEPATRPIYRTLWFILGLAHATLPLSLTTKSLTMACIVLGTVAMSAALYMRTQSSGMAKTPFLTIAVMVIVGWAVAELISRFLSEAAAKGLKAARRLEARIVAHVIQRTTWLLTRVDELEEEMDPVRRWVSSEIERRDTEREYYEMRTRRYEPVRRAGEAEGA